jgi:thiamine monophosphate kinase
MSQLGDVVSSGITTLIWAGDAEYARLLCSSIFQATDNIVVGYAIGMGTSMLQMLLNIPVNPPSPKSLWYRTR